MISVRTLAENCKILPCPFHRQNARFRSSTGSTILKQTSPFSTSRTDNIANEFRYLSDDVCRTYFQRWRTYVVVQRASQRKRQNETKFANIFVTDDFSRYHCCRPFCSYLEVRRPLGRSYCTKIYRICPEGNSRRPRGFTVRRTRCA